MNEIFKNTEKNGEIISLNTELYDKFFVQELEFRLETDPLMLGSFLSLFSSCPIEGCTVACANYSCSGDSSCPEFSCNIMCQGLFS
jgi:hypothetical protein